MLARWLPAVALLFAAASYACAPPTLPPGADDPASDSSSSASSKAKTKKSTKTTTTGDDDDSTAGDDDDSTGAAPTGGNGGGKTSGAQTAAAAPAAFAADYNGLTPTCGTCHGGGGAPTFFTSDEGSTYADFKQQGFNQSGSVLTSKGAHQGPALTPDQVSAINAWISAGG